MTLGKGHLSIVSSFWKDLSPEATGPVSVKFHMPSSGNGIFGPGHMTKMAVMPISIGKKMLTIVLQNFCNLIRRKLDVPDPKECIFTD